MKRAYFYLDLERLVDFLNLPEGTRLLDVEMDSGWVTKQLVLYIEHPDFPDNQYSVEIRPKFESVQSKAIKFVDWGFKKGNKEWELDV